MSSWFSRPKPVTPIATPRHDETAQAYRAVMSTPAGQIVFKDLVKHKLTDAVMRFLEMRERADETQTEETSE